MAAERETPARSRFRTLVRRKSCGILPGHPARRQAVAQDFLKLLMGFPRRWNTLRVIRPRRWSCSVAAFCASSRLRKNRRERRTSSSSRRIERWMTAACAPVLSPPRVRPAEGGARSCGLLGQVPDADEIVDRCGKGEEPVHAARPAMPELAHQADGLEPAEDL